MFAAHVFLSGPLILFNQRSDGHSFFPPLKYHLVLALDQLLSNPDSSYQQNRIAHNLSMTVAEVISPSKKKKK